MDGEPGERNGAGATGRYYLWTIFHHSLIIFFDKCAAISYVSPLLPGKIRTKSIASCLLKKKYGKRQVVFPTGGQQKIWSSSKKQIRLVNIQKHQTLWCIGNCVPTLHLRLKNLSCIPLIMCGQAARLTGIMGVAKQYAVVLLFLLLGIFHSGYWLLLLPVWIIARVTKRIWSHRYEFGDEAAF